MRDARNQHHAATPFGLWRQVSFSLPEKTMDLAGLKPGSASTGCLARCQVSPTLADLVVFMPVMRYPTCPVHSLPVGTASGAKTPTCSESKGSMSRCRLVKRDWDCWWNGCPSCQQCNSLLASQQLCKWEYALQPSYNACLLLPMSDNGCGSRHTKPQATPMYLTLGLFSSFEHTNAAVRLACLHHAMAITVYTIWYFLPWRL